MNKLHSASPRPPRSRAGAVTRGCLVAAAVVLVPLIVLAVITWGGYNRLVERQAAAEQRWAQVENQYKRRYELVPNLVATVEGAADFERETITEVTEARASVGRLQLPADLPDDPARLEAYVAAQQQLGSALGRLLAVAENYPQLRATEAFRDLQSQLEGTENRIAVARMDFTEAVRAYNVQVRRFPTNIVAGLFGFDALPQFTIEAEEAEVPQVRFGDR